MENARPAGFWIRGVALFLDIVLFLLVQFSLGFIAGRVWGAEVEDSSSFQLTVIVFTLLFEALYFTVHHRIGGQTVGKMLVGVRVVMVDGEPLTFGTSFLRFLAYFVSTVTLAFGYLMAGLRRDKRALHDLIAGTRVERLARRRQLEVMPPPADALTLPLA